MYRLIGLAPFLTDYIEYNGHHEDFNQMLTLVGRKYPEIGLFKKDVDSNPAYPVL